MHSKSEILRRVREKVEAELEVMRWTLRVLELAFEQAVVARAAAVAYRRGER